MPTYLSWFFLATSTLMLALWLRERRFRSEALRETESLSHKREAMRRSLEHLAEGVVLLGTRGQVLFLNPAARALLGVKERQGLEDHVPLDRLTRHQGVIELATQTPPGDTVRQVFEVEGKDDDLPMLEVTLAPAGPQRRLMVLQDLRADEAVDRKRRDFVANASHELKTPIAALIGMLDLVESVPEDRRSELLDRARNNALSLSNLLDDLLALTRSESPQWRPSPTVLEIEAEVLAVLEPLKERAAEKGLELRCNLPAPGSTLYVDAFSFRTVLQNLILNAVVYTEKGHVDVDLVQDEAGITRLRVADTGPGIDPEILPRIFERFFRGDVAHSRASGGTGLGLALVRNLLRSMGGRISVQSTPGLGTTFLVELPLDPAEPLVGAG